MDSQNLLLISLVNVNNSFVLCVTQSDRIDHNLSNETRM